MQKLASDSIKSQNNLLSDALEKQVFPNTQDFSAFKTMLASLNHIVPHIISREEYDRKRCNFLVPTGEKDKGGEYFTLYMPDDMVIWDLLSITDKINTTFWLDLYADTNHLITATKVAVWSLLKHNWNDMSIVEDMMKKYHITPELRDKIAAQPLKPTQKIRDFIKSTQQEKDTENGRKISHIAIDMMWEEYKKLLNYEFDLTFFRKWINMLRLWMETITQAEYDQVQEKQNRIKKEEKISFYKDKELLDTKIQLLRDKIDIDTLKNRLSEVRKWWNTEAIAAAEIDATNHILQTLREFPYQKIINWHWWQPNWIVQHKEVQCVWFSLLWHAFLSELYIEHKGLQLIRHSAIMVIINNKQYYFDGTASAEIHEFEYWETHWVYHTIVFKDKEKAFNKIQYSYEWNVENILLGQILNNKYNMLHNLWKYEEANKICDRALELDDNNFSHYNNKWAILYRLWKYEEAIKMYDIALELYPNSSAYNRKLYILDILWRYVECLEVYDAMIKNDPWNTLHYQNKWEFLDSLWRDKEAIEMYDKVLEINPEFFSWYYQKYILLQKLWKKDTADLYWFASVIGNDQLDNYDPEHTERNNRTRENIYMLYKKKKIIRYISQKDFVWLRNYLLSLENI